MFTWKRFILASVGLLVLLLILVSLMLPGIVIEKARDWVAQETGRSLEIGSISINPFSLTVQINKLRLSEEDQIRPFLSWDLLRVSLSIASIYHRAPIIDELHLENPDVQLERLTSDRFNFSNLIPKQKEEDLNEPAGEPIRFSINNLSISGGRVDIIDSSLEKQSRHAIRDLNLVVPSIGNLPYMVENPAQPLFQAVINDSPINLKGELKPFSDIQEMLINLELSDIDLPFYLGYLPIDLPVELRSGRLSLDLDILYRISAETGSELELNGAIDVASLRIMDRQQEQLFFLPLLRIELAPSQPLKQDIHLSSLRIYNLEVQLERDRQGEWNHVRMVSAQEPATTESASEETSSPFNLSIDTIEIRDGVLFFSDEIPTGGFGTVARDINVDVKAFSLDAKNGIPLDLTLKTDRDETVKINGHFLLAPFTLALQTEVRNVDMAAYQPYYHDAYSVPLGGRLSFQTKLDINPEQSLLVSDGRIQWRDAYMAFNEREGLGASVVNISDMSFDLGKNRLEVGSARYEDGRVNFSRNSAGHWSFLSNNFPILEKLTEAPDRQPAPKAAEKGVAFSYRIGELTANNWAFDVVDNLPATPVKLNADKFNLTFRNLAAPERVDSPFTFSTLFQHKGQIEIKGIASLADKSINMNSRLKGIPLASFSPYLAEQANLILAEGYFNARLKSSIRADSESLQAELNGDVGINRFYLLDTLHNEDLLKWDSLQFAGINARAEPLILRIESVTLSDYYSKIAD